MKYFQYVDGLYALEQAEKWDEARILLDRRWKEDKPCCAKLIRLLAECWYVLSLWDCRIDTEMLDYQTFQSALLECTEYGMSKCSENPKFLCLAGYMIAMLPHLFCLNGEEASYSHWEKEGLDLLKKARGYVPQDPVVKLLYLGFVADKETLRREKAHAAHEISELFSGKTAVETYFYSILTV